MASTLGPESISPQPLGQGVETKTIATEPPAMPSYERSELPPLIGAATEGRLQ
jgi:hypothetical protein